MTDQAPIIIIIIPLMFALITPLLGWIRKNLCYPWVLLSITISALSSFIILRTVLLRGVIHYRLGNWDPPWGIEYVIDHLNALMLVIITVISLIVAVYSKKSIQREIPDKIVYFYTIFLLQVTGYLGIVISGDLFNIYVFLEIASLAGYSLIAIGDERAPYASFRYVVMGTIGASFYLLSVGYIYSVTGSLNIADVARLLPDLYNSNVILTALVFMFAGIGIKMAVFPMHAWAPNAYTHAPSAVSALMAPLMTKVAAYLMIRVSFTVFKPEFIIDVISLNSFISWIGAVGVLVGSIFAIAQNNLKKMLSYSVVAQIGYIALGIGLANNYGLTGAVLHIVNEAFTKGCLFLVAGGIVYRLGGCNINDFKNLFRKMPFTMTAFTIGAFSLIGIPPTCGFFSKLYLILGSIEADQWIFVGVLLFSSILNVIYFFRVIQVAAFEKQMPDHSREGPYEAVVIDEVPLTMLIPIQVTALGILLCGIFSTEIISAVIKHVIPVSF
ncbi:MAG: hypothetical protein A2176_13290 [Spirochaetes bacterium RBG_13_51_14]|nr:MAG: hypothetical protein A2176_13290 [Spirochaetes bacterium RBG_13_51_14]